VRPPAKDTPVNSDSIPRACFQVLPGETQILIGRGSDPNDTKRSFTYDTIFGPNSTQDQIYHDIGAPLVSQFFDGFNATILAYGQTFSGKTYTMGSNNMDNPTENEQGIIPRVIKDLFRKIEADNVMNYITKVSFLEVYQEQVRDLLATTDQPTKEINIREIKGHILVSGITEELALGVDDMIKILQSGIYIIITFNIRCVSQINRRYPHAPEIKSISCYFHYYA
jgi:hypothetical protein